MPEPCLGPLVVYAVYTMKRKQIYLREDQERRLRQLAERRRTSEAALLREALDVFLAESGIPFVEKMEDHPLWGIVGLAGHSGGPTDGSINHDHYIYGTPKKYRIREDGTVEKIRRR